MEQQTEGEQIAGNNGGIYRHAGVLPGKPNLTQQWFLKEVARATQRAATVRLVGKS